MNDIVSFTDLDTLNFMFIYMNANEPLKLVKYAISRFVTPFWKTKVKTMEFKHWRKHDGKNNTFKMALQTLAAMA